MEVPVSEKEQQRVSKREFLAQVASRSGIPLRTVTRVYDASLEQLMEITSRGDQLMLTGFGKFYPQAHKGHRVQFADGAEVIDDYAVLKFSATRSINKALVQKPGDDSNQESTEQGAGETETLFADGSEGTADDKPARRTKKPNPSTVSLTAAAMQSPRVINRASRQQAL